MYQTKHSLSFSILKDINTSFFSFFFQMTDFEKYFVSRIEVKRGRDDTPLKEGDPTKLFNTNTPKLPKEEKPPKPNYYPWGLDESELRLKYEYEENDKVLKITNPVIRPYFENGIKTDTGDQVVQDAERRKYFNRINEKNYNLLKLGIKQFERRMRNEKPDIPYHGWGLTQRQLDLKIDFERNEKIIKELNEALEKFLDNEKSFKIYEKYQKEVDKRKNSFTIQEKTDYNTIVLLKKQFEDNAKATQKNETMRLQNEKHIRDSKWPIEVDNDVEFVDSIPVVEAKPIVKPEQTPAVKPEIKPIVKPERPIEIDDEKMVIDLDEIDNNVKTQPPPTLVKPEPVVKAENLNIANIDGDLENTFKENPMQFYDKYIKYKEILVWQKLPTNVLDKFTGTLKNLVILAKRDRRNIQLLLHARSEGGLDEMEQLADIDVLLTLKSIPSNSNVLKNKDFALYCVKLDGLTLEYFSFFKDEPDVIMAAFLQNHNSIRFTSNDAQLYYDDIMMKLDKTWPSIKLQRVDKQNNMEFVKKIIKTYPLAYQHLNKVLKLDKEIVSLVYKSEYARKIVGQLAFPSELFNLSWYKILQGELFAELVESSMNFSSKKNKSYKF
jgi:hypothetical protein